MGISKGLERVMGTFIFLGKATFVIKIQVMFLGIYMVLESTLGEMSFLGNIKV